MTKISAVLPDRLHEPLAALARQNDRSLSAEVRQAVTAYLAFRSVPPAEGLFPIKRPLGTSSEET